MDSQHVAALERARTSGVLRTHAQKFPHEKKVRVASLGIANNVLDDKQRDHLMKLISEGESQTNIILLTGVSTHTVVRYRKIFLEDGGVIKNCACGQRGDHKGWCSVRYANSDKRQDAIIKMWWRRMLRHHRERALDVLGEEFAKQVFPEMFTDFT